MIVYHIAESAKIKHYLSTGLKRTEKRFYVFDQWSSVEKALKSYGNDLSPQNGNETSDIKILVINADKDILIKDRIPQSHLFSNLESKDLEILQNQSFYLETDLTVACIVAIKDIYGNDISKQYRQVKQKGKSVLRFLKYAKPYWYFYFFAAMAGTAKFLLPLVFPKVLKIILDDVLLNTSMTFAFKKAQIFHLIIFVLIVNVLWMVASYWRSIFAALGGHRMIRDLRVALFNHVQRLSHSFFTKRQSGAIVSRLVNDIALAQNFIGSALTNVWMDGLLLIVLLIILLKTHVVLTLISISLFPIFLLSIRFVSRKVKLTSREIQQRVAVISGGLQERIAGFSVIKGFSHETEEYKKFVRQANKLYSKVLRSVKYSATNEMIIGFIVSTTPVLIVWYSSYQILLQKLTIGEMTQFLLYLHMFYAPVQRLAELNIILANSLAAIERIFEYFDIQPQVVEKQNALKLIEIDGDIEFDDVDFCYESNILVLENIQLSIKAGETVALVGVSGSGKSTLANLVPRFYDPVGGVIRIDGHDIKDFELDSLRSHIGIVNQETILFSGTIRENLLLANPVATPQEIEEALIAANAMEFVEDMNEGLWTEIGERGATLSGGQKQRLAIARSFLKNPKILILDEATSALDSTSEKMIQNALSRLLVNRTSIIIAHRLSTVVHADKIVVLNQGKIVEIGQHQDLYNKNGYYASLCRDQLFNMPDQNISL